MDSSDCQYSGQGELVPPSNRMAYAIYILAIF